MMTSDNKPNSVSVRKEIIGMIHLKPLPGTPFYEEGNFEQIINDAIESAVVLWKAGASGCLIQTVDRVYKLDNQSDPARTAAMGIIVNEVRKATDKNFLVGVQIMKNAVNDSLAVAKIADADFIRVATLVGVSMSDHGIVQGNPYELAEYRGRLKAESVQIWADVHTRHFRWLMKDSTPVEVSKKARDFGAGAVVIEENDEARLIEILKQVKREVTGVKVIIGGGTNHANAARLLQHADGAFVGKCLEKEGWGGKVDSDLVESYMNALNSAQDDV